MYYGDWFILYSLILGHKKIKAFVSQSGIHSTIETVFYGVPLVTIPVYVDQFPLAQKSVLDGYAIKLNLRYLTADQLYDAIMNVSQDLKFRENVKKRQAILKDDPMTPLERGVYWIEYVIRHKGALHFQSSANKNLNVWQYYSVDVVAIMIIALVFVLLILWWILKMVGRFFAACIFTQKKKKDD